MHTHLLSVAAIALIACPSSLRAQFHDDFTGTKVRPEWTWTDPGNDSAFKLGPVAGHLRMTVPPGNDHTTGHRSPLYAGPKLTVKTSGDFTITTYVSVNYPRVPAAKESGLMIWKDRSNNLQFKRTNAFNGQNVLFYGNISNARTTFHGNTRVSANSLFLRVTRVGSKFTSSFSTDGTRWTQAGSVTWKVSGVVEVGLATSFWLWFGNTRAPAIGDYAFFDLNVPNASMTADRPGFSAAAGATTVLRVAAGAGRARQIYLVLGSLAGSRPGIRLPGNARLPLNLDPFFNLMLALPGTPGLFPGTIGQLDKLGAATARVIVPAGALNSAFGRSLYFAAVMIPPGIVPMGATNAAEVAIVR